MVGISVDSPDQNAAMVEKLRLPFPLLSDPGGELAIKPYGVWDEHDPRQIARPAVVVVTPAGEEVFHRLSRDFADRLSEDEAIDVLRGLGLPPTEQAPPRPGSAAPGPKAMPIRAMSPYYRGAKFAVTAMKRRFPATGDDADRYIAQMDRYLAALSYLKD